MMLVSPATTAAQVESLVDAFEAAVASLTLPELPPGALD